MILGIKYNNEVIAILKRGQVAIIPCDGKKMLTDIVVSCETVEEEPKPAP